MGFGARVAFLREREGLLQKELAEIVGLSARKLSDYEREISTPKDDVKIKLAKALDISMDYLMGLNDDLVSYDRKDQLPLPKDYPPAAKAELMEYAKFLYQKHKK